MASGAVSFVLAAIFSALFLVLLTFIGYILFARYRATSAGLPPPPLSSYNPIPWLRSHLTRTSSSTSSYARSNDPLNPSLTKSPVAWLKSKISPNKRTTGAGAYEGASRSGHRGASAALDPDEAWDSRVGAEADAYGMAGYGGVDEDDDEHEMGLANPPPYGHGGYDHIEDEEAGATRSARQEQLDERFGEEMGARGRGQQQRENPFSDDAATAISLRGISPRPEADTSYHGAGDAMKGPDGAGEVVTKPTSGSSKTDRRSVFQENISPPPTAK